MELVNSASIDAMLKPHAVPSVARSTFQFVSTLALYVAGWIAMLWLLKISYWLVLLASLPTAGFLVRLFIIQHDCGHGSFFRSRRANEIVGGILGILTVTPYRAWRRRHAAHHASTGNLDDDRSLGSFTIFTVDEYRALSRWHRVWYRIYRNPFLLFFITAPIHFAILQRFPQTTPATWRAERRSVHWTNLAVAILFTTLVLLVGWKRLLLLQLPITIITSAAGMWLFFVQHQFEKAYWARQEEWSYHAASLYGSTFYDLPSVMHWFTGNIGFHQVHHLNSRIPNYRLKECLEKHEILNEAPRLKFFESLRCGAFALWDEKRRMMVSFREA